MKKRIFCILLTLALLFSLLPAALAEDIEIVDREDFVGADALGGPEDEIAIVDPAATAPADDPASSGTCGENLTWTLDDAGTLTISGTGEMESYTNAGAPWYEQREIIKSVCIESGVTSIGRHAFSSCTSLTSVTIPDSVTSIDDTAFSACLSLTSVTIPDGVTSIGSAAFFWCCELTSVTIGSGVKSIGDFAFSGCRSLTSVTIPASVTSVGGWAFEKCGSLTEITFSGSAPEIDEDCFSEVTATAYYPADDPSWTEDMRQDYGGTIAWVPYTPGEQPTIIATGECGDNLTWTLDDDGTLTISGTGDMWNYGREDRSPWYADPGITKVVVKDGVTSIGDWSFNKCKSLTSVTIPDSVTSIGAWAFAGCTALVELQFGKNLQIIGDWAFYCCGSLSMLTLPDSVTNVGDASFGLCMGLTKLTVGKGVTRIGNEAFSGCEALKEIVFRGSAPQIGNSCFTMATATAKYPANDPSWTEDMRQDYGGTITWEPYNPEDAPAVPVLSLSGMTTAGAALSWTAVDGADLYALVRIEEGLNIAQELNATEYLDKTVLMGVTYTYRVRAHVNGAWTEYSDPVEVFFNPFTDVSGKKTIEYVAWAYNNGIVKGAGPTQFVPDDPCTRVQFVMMLWKMNGSPVVEGENPFSDISGAKTTKAILWALDAGVINSGKTFNPNGNISRVQIVMMLWKLAGSPTVTGDNPFTDVSGKKTTNAVLWAYQNGITKGTSATTFAPDKDCTRVQLVVFLYKYNGIYHVI